MSGKTETYNYDVEMNNLMSIIINSMYSSKELFLRELISNASDACDKLNTIRLDLKDLQLNTDQKIRIRFEDDRLIISDTGIGMKKDELKEFLGCVANSGTKKFREALKNNQKTEDLIGQFGLGFYSAFLVSDHVSVISKYPGEDAFQWESTGLGQYSISESEMTGHGTSVILRIKEGCQEFLKKERIIDLIKKFSMFITYPIIVESLVEEEIKEPENKVEEEVENQENKDENKVEEDDKKVEEVENQENKDQEKAEENKVEEKKEKKMHWVKKEELINKEKPLWSVNKKDITKEMYSSFYKTISNDWDDYLALNHSHIQGALDLDILIFAPKRPPFNMFSQDKKKKTVKLYCSSVFVSDDLDLPDWMQMITGVVASTDLPINVSREMLQGSHIKRSIKRELSKKIVQLIKGMSPEVFSQFYKEFSSMIKLAARDESREKNEFIEMLRFHSNQRESVSFNEYLKNMKEDQKKIYLITGLSKEEVIKSPFVSMFKDFEVLFLIDPIDEYLLQNLKKYKDFELVKINQEGVEIPNSSVSEEMEKTLEPLKQKILNILDSEVEKVEFKNLNNKHMVVIAPAHAPSPAMQRVLQAQVSLDKNNMFMFPKTKKNLHVNPSHPVTLKLNALLEDEAEFKKNLDLVYKAALLSCGYELEDNAAFSDLLIDMIIEKKKDENVDENMPEVV